MAVAFIIRTPELTPLRYDEVIARLELDSEPSVGQILHAALETPDGIVVHEIWQTVAAGLHYVEHRLAPALRAARAGEPAVEIVQLHNLYAADLDTIERIGAVSLPAHAPGAALY
jgi:hypothetical protein